ncbi:MAG: hypothetical protein ACKOCI_07780, partial [Cyanobium sp.]
GAGQGPTNPYFEPGLDDWLGGTKGLPDPKKARPILITGKISGTLYDHFGDFEGFTLEAYNGRHYQFYSREEAILELDEMAREHRRVVTVVTTIQDSRQVRRLLLAYQGFWRSASAAVHPRSQQQEHGAAGEGTGPAAPAALGLIPGALGLMLAPYLVDSTSDSQPNNLKRSVATGQRCP